MHRLVLGFIALLATAFSLARGETTTAKTPDFSVETSGNFKNIQAIDPELLKQAQNFATLRQIPSADNLKVVPWLLANSTELPPPFLLETARRLWEMDRREDAFELYALALVRTRYDALRCKDVSAQQVLLPPIAANVAAGVDQLRSAFSEAGLRAIARTDAFSSKVSPWWVCSQGISSIRAALEHKSLDQSAWLKPEEDWESLRKEIIASFTSFLAEQGKPQNDPVPMSNVTYRVMTVGMGEYNDFAWIDSEHLVFGEWLRDPASRSPTTVLRQWQDGTTEELARFKGAWCAGHGVVSHYVDHQKSDEKSRNFTFMVGKPHAATSETIAFGSDALSYARFVHDGSLWGRGATDPKRQSPFDCRWVKSVALSGAKNQGNWLALLPGHGFLSFTTSDGQSAERILFYREDASPPVELPIPAKNMPSDAVRYFTYKRAYFISSLSRARPVSAEEKASNCRPVWWFFPEQARVETVCAPVDDVTLNFPIYWPSRVGLLRQIKSRRTSHGFQPGGIYLTSTGGRSEKIYEGSIKAMAVSPDGCKIAMIHYPETLDPKRLLNVIELCSEERTPNTAIVK